MKQKIFLTSSLLLFISFSLSSCLQKIEIKEENQTGTVEVETGTVENEKAQKLLDYGNSLDYVEAYDSYLEAVNILEKKGIKNLNKIEAKTLIEAYKKAGNGPFSEVERYDESMNLLNKLDENYEIVYYKGYTNRISENYDKALNFFEQGLEKYKDMPNNWKALYLGQLGYIYEQIGDVEKSKNYYLELKSIREKQGF